MMEEEGRNRFEANFSEMCLAISFLFSDSQRKALGKDYLIRVVKLIT